MNAIKESIVTSKSKKTEILSAYKTIESLKEKLAEKEKAIFGGEMSAHYYFKKNANRDNGMIPLLLILEMMSTKRKKLSRLVDPLMKKYFVSGEINFKVTDAKAIMQTLEERYANGLVEHIDGLSVAFGDWRFNVRSSNTEPLLRLNVEARSRTRMRQKTRELEQAIQGL